jgi:hypothetical protein
LPELRLRFFVSTQDAGRSRKSPVPAITLKALNAEDAAQPADGCTAGLRRENLKSKGDNGFYKCGGFNHGGHGGNMKSKGKNSGSCECGGFNRGGRRGSQRKTFMRFKQFVIPGKDPESIIKDCFV